MATLQFQDIRNPKLFHSHVMDLIRCMHLFLGIFRSDETKNNGSKNLFLEIWIIRFRNLKLIPRLRCSHISFLLVNNVPKCSRGLVHLKSSTRWLELCPWHSKKWTLEGWKLCLSLFFSERWQMKVIRKPQPHEKVFIGFLY